MACTRASFNFQPVLRFALKRGAQDRIGNKYGVYIIYIYIYWDELIALNGAFNQRANLSTETRVSETSL